MNKKRISMTFASLFCATAMLAGCGKTDGENVKEVDSMKLSGIQTAYQLDETINWSALKVSVTYKDKSKETYTGSQIQYDVTSEVAEATKIVVYTAGLHDQTTLTEGEYNVEAALVSKLTEKHSLGRIVVGKVTDDKYTLDSFEAPEFVDTYRQKIADSEAHLEEESSFKSTSDLFTVGTKNVFKFVPRASFELKGATGGHAKRYTNYEKNFFLKEIKADSSKVDADVNDYSIPADQSGVQFNESAVGKKFELTVSPKDGGFAQDSNGHPAVVTFSFQVKSGLNVYTAKELGALNFTSKGLVYNANENHAYDSHIGKADGLPEANHSNNHYTNVRTNGVPSNFWDPIAKQYNKVDYNGLWRDFLKYDEKENPSGIFSPEEIEKYTDLKGVFFQNEITLDVNDIPADYFIYADEPGNVDHYAEKTCVRDGAEIYTPIINAAENSDDRSQDVEINGNYFMLDNKLPICKSGRDDDGFHTFGDVGTGLFPGHASLFKFCGYDTKRNDVWRAREIDVLKGAKGIIRNLNTKGVIDDVSGDNILSVTALIAAKNTFCCADYINNIFKSYQIGVFPDNMIQGEQTFTFGSKTVHYNTRIENCRIYDCSNSAICNYHNGGAIVLKSSFARFGGAAILNAGDIEERRDDGTWPYAEKMRDAQVEETGHSDIDPKAETSDYEDIWRSFTYVDEESSTSFNNYVVGTEAYFMAVGASMFFNSILPQYAEFITHSGNAFRFTQGDKQVYNIIALNLDGHDYVASKNKGWYGDVVLNAGGQKQLAASCKDTSSPLNAWGVYTALGQAAPIFYTEEGEMFTCIYNPLTDDEGNIPDKLKEKIKDFDDATQEYIKAQYLAAIKQMVTIQSVQQFFGTGDYTKLVKQPQLQGKTMSVLLPVALEEAHSDTTINAVFEVQKLA